MRMTILAVIAGIGLVAGLGSEASRSGNLPTGFRVYSNGGHEYIRYGDRKVHSPRCHCHRRDRDEWWWDMAPAGD